MEQQAGSKTASRWKPRLWRFLILVIGGLIGAAAALSFLPITGPPAGFWVVFLLPVLKLLIGWPMAVVIAILVFRKEIGNLIPRTEKGPLGMAFRPAAADAQAAAKRSGAEMISGEARAELSGIEVRATGKVEAISGVEARAAAGDVRVAPAVASAEATAIPPSTDQVIPSLHPAVAERFQILNETLAPGEPAEDRLRRALVDLADLEVRFGFEKTYRIITGSQLNALLHLHARPLGVAEEDLKQFYTRDPATAKSLPWDTWRWFLAWTGLVRFDEEKRTVRITPGGELFLTYLLRERYTDPKPL